MKRMAIGIGAGLILLGVMGVAFLMKSMGSEDDLVSVGRVAPDFTASDSDGKTVHLAESQGKKAVILVFYPGDGTPVCTAQLCALRDNWHKIEASGATVYGINPADAKAHTQFSKDNRFPFPLLVDSDHKIAKLYGCDSAVGFTKRTVYVIGKDGRILWVQRGNPSPDTILAALK